MAKIHYRLSTYIGVCGFQGETTKDKKKVTCKFCKKLLKSTKYLE